MSGTTSRASQSAKRCNKGTPGRASRPDCRCRGGAAHPFQVQFSSYYGCSFVLYIDGEATGSKISLPGPPVSFRMAHSMTLEDARCGFKHVPADEILVRVNGSWYSPKWVQETAGRPGDPPSFKATLLPQLKSPK